MTTKPKTFIARPFREQIPNDFGGPVARQGFAYQDHVSAMFCLEMLVRPRLQEVCCETYDDIVLVWLQPDGSELIEFVQVKNEALNQLYSPAIFLRRKDNKPGSSIFERSLNRDTLAEEVRFRIVTSRGIQNVLWPLTLNRDDGSRAQHVPQFKALESEMLKNPAGSAVSPKGASLEFWTERTLWETYSLGELEFRNKSNLARYLERCGLPVYTDTVDDLYQRLLWKVKTAAEADFFTARQQKTIRRDDVGSWLQEQAAPLPTPGSNAKLREKLTAASEGDEAVSSAIEMRQRYNQELRNPSYLSLEHTKLVTEKVRGVLFRLRLDLDSGKQPEGHPFHCLCLDKVKEVKDDCADVTPKPPEGFLYGCMYEITSRCRHRFNRPKP